MLLRFEDKNENEITNPSNLKTYSAFNNKGTHINFGSNFTSNRNGLVPVYEVNTNGVDIAILEDTGFKGHLVWPPYGTDFEGTLLVNGIERDYTVTLKRLTSKRVKVSVHASPDLSNGDVVEFRSESIFGLNLIDLTFNLVLDTTKPTAINVYNRTDVRNNTDFIQSEGANLSLFLGDIYLDALNISHNASGVDVNNTFTITQNDTYSLVIPSSELSEGEVVGWAIYAYDSVGNLFTSSHTFRVDFDNKPPGNVNPGGSTPVTKFIPLATNISAVPEEEELTPFQQFWENIKNLFGFGDNNQQSQQPNPPSESGGLFSINPNFRSNFDLAPDLKLVLFAFLIFAVAAVLGFFILTITGIIKPK